MDITTNYNIEKKESWWKVLMSFGSISKNDVEENEINEIEKQQDNKYIKQLEKSISEVVVEKTKKKNSKTTNQINIDAKNLNEKTNLANNKENHVHINDENEHIIE